MASLASSVLFAGIRGHVVALDQTTGAELWRQKLKGVGFVNVIGDGDRVYAATAGEVFCLEGHTGTVLWNNPLKGLGLGLVSLLAGSGAGQGQAVLLEEMKRKERQRQAAS